MVMGPGKPFADDIEESDIEQATLIEQYHAARVTTRQKAGCETWCAAWSPDGRFFAWSKGSRIVKLIPWNRHKHCPATQDEYDAEGHRLDSTIVTIDAGELIWSLAFGSTTAETRVNSHNLNWYHYRKFEDLTLAIGLQNGRIRTWDVRSGQLMLELVDHTDVIRDLKFAPDGSLRLVSASRDSTLKVWDLQDDGNMFRTLKCKSTRWMYSCAWSPDSRQLCSVGNARSVHLWDMKVYKSVGSLEGHHHDVVGCDYSPDGALLATASYDTTVIIWDPHRRTILMTLQHQYPTPSPIFAGGDNGSFVRDVSFSHDGHHVTTVCDDKFVRFWNLFSPECPEQICEENQALCCSFSPDGTVLAVGTRNGSASLWLAPMQVSSLQHMCRMAIRRVMPFHIVAKLKLPERVKTFLQFNSRCGAL